MNSPLKKALVTLLLLPPLLAQAGERPLNPEEQTNLVAAHNRWRGNLGLSSLTWAGDLAQNAQTWANSLGKNHNCTMQHSRNRTLAGAQLGENLYWASPVTWSDGRREVQAISPPKVVDAWGSEVKDYDYGANTCRPGKMCGHYTQVVWRDTREVGCGAHVCPGGEQVWVCQYRPAGNWVGQRPY